MQVVMRHFQSLRRIGYRLGPYLVLEILLPGGTLLALLLFLYQRRKRTIENLGSRTALAVTRALGMIAQGIFARQPRYLAVATVERGIRNGLDPRDVAALPARSPRDLHSGRACVWGLPHADRVKGSQ